MPIDTSAAQAALDTLGIRLVEACREAAGDAAHAAQTAARAFAPLGIGTLRASIIVDGPRNVSSMTGLNLAVPRGPYVYAAKVGPTVVYGRIREIGGAIPGRRTTMTHPYLRWWWGGHWVFRRSSPQSGTKYLLHGVEAVVPLVNIMLSRRATAVIESM